MYFFSGYFVRELCEIVGFFEDDFGEVFFSNCEIYDIIS